MNVSIEDLVQVSDGIVVQFSTGLACYFPADFLLEQAGLPSTQILVRQQDAWLSVPRAAAAEDVSTGLTAH